MTTYHDLVLATAPALFVPWDAPGDGSPTAGVNLGSAGGVMVQTVGGVRQDAPGLVEFGKEILLDGVDDYWSANSTLFNALVAATAAATDGSTWGCWWRSTDDTAGPRYAMRMDPWGMGIRRASEFMLAEYYDTAASTLHQVQAASTSRVERGGGWQLSGFSIDPVEGTMILYRNGFPQLSGGGTVNASTDTIRTSGATSFVIGRNPSTGAASSWNGSIGPIFMWPRVLTPQEFLDIYYWGLDVQPTREITAQRPYIERMRPDVLMRGTG